MIDFKTNIREFVINNFLFGDGDGLEDNTSFLAEEIIDSTGVLELINFIEEEFGIRVEDEELIPENFDSVENLSSFLAKKQAVRLAQ